MEKSAVSAEPPGAQFRAVSAPGVALMVRPSWCPARELAKTDDYMTTLGELSAHVERRAAVIGAPRGVLPVVGPADGYGVTRLEVLDDGSLAWSFVERGQVTRHVAEDLDELLYQAFVPVCFNMAMPWESMHRVPDIDFRAVMFARELYLLGRLDPRWPARYRPHLEEVLTRRPYAHEDPPKASAAVRAYCAVHGAEFTTEEMAAVERIEGRRSTADALSGGSDFSDFDVLRRFAAYVALTKQHVDPDEARAVAALIPPGP
jgi:hypothetical protein